MLSDHASFDEYMLLICRGPPRILKVLECMCLAIVLPIRSSVFPGVRVAAMVCLRSLFFEFGVTGGKLVAQTHRNVL